MRAFLSIQELNEGDERFFDVALKKLKHSLQVARTRVKEIHPCKIYIWDQAGEVRLNFLEGSRENTGRSNDDAISEDEIPEDESIQSSQETQQTPEKPRKEVNGKTTQTTRKKRRAKAEAKPTTLSK